MSYRGGVGHIEVWYVTQDGVCNTEEGWVR